MAQGTERPATARESIKRALLGILAQKPVSSVTVAEACREAGVSRTAFYRIYRNVVEVYADLVDDCFAESDSVYEHYYGLRTRSGREVKPICSIFRRTDEYAPVLRDPLFLTTFFDGHHTAYKGYIPAFVEQGYTVDQAEAIFTFHLSGCYAAAMRTQAEDRWACDKCLIDRFVKAGLTELIANPEETTGASPTERAQRPAPRLPLL